MGPLPIINVNAILPSGYFPTKWPKTWKQSTELESSRLYYYPLAILVAKKDIKGVAVFPWRLNITYADCQAIRRWTRNSL